MKTKHEEQQRCNHCMTVFAEELTACPKCGKDDALMFPFSNLSAKNQAKYEALNLPYRTSCSGLFNRNEDDLNLDELEHAKDAANENHALVEENERLRDYMERLWTELSRLQSVCGEVDFPIIEDLLNEKEEAIKQEVGE